MTMAWSLYASDSNEKVANNFGLPETMATVSAKSYLNWNHNIVDWTSASANTNKALVMASKLFPYLENDTTVFKCPADTFLSTQQRSLGWSARVRSYSMNGFMGPYSANKADSTYQGQNSLYPNYRQFLVTSSIPRPQETMVFIDEHPDSINDGYFVVQPGTGQPQWLGLPASYHAGAAGISFADGSAELHQWQYASTIKPVRFNFVLSGSIPAAERGDYNWLSQRQSVTHSTLAVSPAASNQVQVVWSSLPATYVPQSATNLTDNSWTNMAEVPIRDLGRVAVKTEIGVGEKFFRLMRP